ncbi:MAG: RecQ family ATP-dependent DNA helicase [Flavobacteriaceae bacterium]
MSSMQLTEELKKYFGFSHFKGLQEEVIKNVLARKNSFVLMPTGGGKSLCYQLPGLMSEGTAIVVSPLIALMKNQVDAIRGISQDDGVAHVLNSSLSKTAIEKVKKDIREGITKLLFVAPESLTKQGNLEFLKQSKISFLAIDEAHCISEWGHDFRPDYRNLRFMLEQIDRSLPVIALTATATPKVQEDIMKNLQITNAQIFKASFNRPNLYYEVRPKTDQVEFEIIKFIKERKGKSGIIYCLSRKKVEELAQILQVNAIKAIPYHAGLDAKTRAKNQDAFLKEECDVVVATIAFGMGIDKPDVRFVLHHDIPKSIESYYQETGRAGRDGGEGHCLAFYAYKDIEKLEKFMSGKPVAEQEIGVALLKEMVAYAETSISRRKFILHYFGEEFDSEKSDLQKMDDNIRFPKPKTEAQTELTLLLTAIKETREQFKAKEVVKTLVGEQNAIINSHHTASLDIFGKGQNKNKAYWMALIRQANVAGFLKKDIETYGIIRLTSNGKAYLTSPQSFMMTEDHSYKSMGRPSVGPPKDVVNDKRLKKILLELRKTIANRNAVPPYTVFQENSINDMTLKYPISHEELVNIHGVGEGKAKRYGKEFLSRIQAYVDENEITRPDDLIVKSTGANSSLKLYMIQSVDRKLPLDDIASAKGMSMNDFINEMETIMFAGTKLDISYWIDELLDEDQQEELYAYFMEAESDDISQAIEEFDGDYDEEEIRLYRIKFMNEVAN